MSENSTPIILQARGIWTQFVRPLRERLQFSTNGALTGVQGAPRTYGELPVKYRYSAAKADYVVYSFDTPIAWHTAAGWRMPPVSYSPITSRHQSKINMALSQIEEENE